MRRRIHVLLDDTGLTPIIDEALRRLDADAEITTFATDCRNFPSKRSDARIVVTSNPRAITNGKLDRLLAWCRLDPCATLVLSGHQPPEGTWDHRRTAEFPIAFASGLSGDDLTGRLAAMCSFRASLDHFRHTLSEVRRRNARQTDRLARLNHDLEYAGSMQRSLRGTTPHIVGATIRTLYRPLEEVGGDLLDVVRVDDDRIAIVLADVTGHGVGAGLLAAYVKRSLQGCEWVDGKRFVLSPAEVLARANRDLLESAPPDCEFATATYAVYDERRRVIRWARAGAPYPLVMRGDACAEAVESTGPLLGVLDDPHFETVELQLSDGDTILFHSDGLNGHRLGRTWMPAFRASVEEHRRIARSRPGGPHSDGMDEHLPEKSFQNDPPDDKTLVALHVHA